MFDQETVSLQMIDNQQTVQSCENSYLENDPDADCPDCFDTLVKIYGSDRIRYRCENCDLVISETQIQKIW
jgi:hypothetical protein